MKKALIGLFLAVSPVLLHAGGAGDGGVVIQWVFNSNESFYIDKYTEQSILKNGRLERRYSIKELSVLELVSRQGGNQFLSGIYRSYERNMERTNGPYKLTTEYPLSFAISNNGVMTVPGNADLPNIRDIPCFPSSAVKPGDRWSHSGYEIFLFEPPIRVPFMADYIYTGNEKKDGVECGRVNFGYSLDYRNDSGSGDVPSRFGGDSVYALWYDLKAGAPWYMESSYDILFVYPDSESIEYKGGLAGHYYRHKRYADRDRIGLLKKVRKALRTAGKDVTVRTNDRGVVISLSEIFFDFDSSRVNEKERKKLAVIGKVLKNNSGFEVIIEGHTDDTGSGEYNQRLSENRAANALDFFIRNGSLNPVRGSYAGKGETDPAWPNDSEENRRKNRRVDIIIKQE